MSVLLEPAVISAIIIGASIVTAVYGVAFVIRSVLLEIRLGREGRVAISHKDFHSTFGEQRKELERQLYKVNQELADTRNEFRSVFHLVLEAQEKDKRTDQESNSFKEMFNIGGVKPNKDYVFVLTPFSDEEKSTYSFLVDFFQRQGKKVARGDETSSTGDVLSHIVRQIAAAGIVIANLNGRNPNVMYELGIAQALGKRVLLIAHTRDNLPFDVQSQRTILYNNRKELEAGLTQSLLSHL